MNLKTVSKIDKDGYFSGSEDAQLHPVSCEVMLPAGAVDLEPPVLGEHEAAKLVDGAWVIVPDYSNIATYSTATGELVQVQRGQSLEEAGATLTKPAPKLADLHKSALTRIDSAHAEMVQAMVGNPTQVEKDTWAMKLETAQALQAGATPPATGAAFLAAAAITTDAAKTAWAAAVLRSAAGYATVVGLAETVRKEAKAAVTAATTGEAIESALVEAKTKADAAVAQVLAAMQAANG